MSKAHGERNEVILEINDMKEIRTEDGRIGLAHNIRALLLKNKYTNPNDPDMGVGLRNYMFTQFDDKLRSQLSGSIESQINRYIQSDIVIQVRVNTYMEIRDELNQTNILDTKPNENTLFVFIVLKPEEPLKEDMSNVVKLAMDFDTDSEGNLLSHMYLG